MYIVHLPDSPLLQSPDETFEQVPPAGPERNPPSHRTTSADLISIADYYVYDFDAVPLENIDWDKYPKPKFIIKVLGYNRFQSLKRSLESLQSAYYDGDTVDIDIFIDHIKIEPPSDPGESFLAPGGMKATSAEELYDSEPLNDQDRNYDGEMISQFKQQRLGKLLETDDTMVLSNVSSWGDLYSANRRDLCSVHAALYYLTREFEWPHGSKRIHYRSTNTGLQAQWVESWWPASMDEFAYVVEDDVVVSSWWYRYMKKAVQVYYYDDRARDDRVFGISTQNQAYSVGRDERGAVSRVLVYNHNRPFLFGTVGSWGQVLFPRHWIQFRLWYDTVKQDPSYHPVIEGAGKSVLRTTQWYNSVGNKIWTPWFLKFMVKQNWYGMYVNFPSRKYLSVSYQEAGVSYKRTEGPNSPLVSTGDQIRWTFPDASKLQSFDACFSRTTAGKIFKMPATADGLNEYEFQRFLWDYSWAYRVVIIVYGADDPLLLPLYYSWICAAESISLNKYIFVTGNDQVAYDLTLKGAGVLLVPGIKQYSQPATNPNAQDILEYRDSVTALMFGTTTRLHGKYRNPPQEDRTFVGPLMNFDYYIRRHHLHLSKFGKEILGDRASADAKLAYAVDLLAEQALRYGYNVAFSHYLTVYTGNPYDKIFQKDRPNPAKPAKYTDIYIAPAYNVTVDAWHVRKENPVQQPDYREFMFIKCTKRTLLAYSTIIRNTKKAQAGYVPIANRLVYETTSGRPASADYPALGPEELEAVGDLRLETLPANQYSTVYQKYRQKKGLVNTHQANAVVHLPDVKCCINENQLVKGVPRRLLTALDDYQGLLEDLELASVDRIDVMCKRMTCFSIHYRWALEAQAREFDQGQT